MLGELLSVFWWDGFDFVGINTEFYQSFSSRFLVGLAGLGIAASVVVLALGFFSVELFASAWRKVDRLHDHVGGASDLLRRQQFATDNIFTRRKLLTNSGTEQLAQNRHEQMPMDATPAAALEMVQTEFFFRFTEAVFDRPASERHAKNLSQSPAVATRHAIRKEVFHFTGEHVASHDQGALVADQLVGVNLPPARCPANFPDFAAAMSLFDAILLWRLFAKGG